METYVTIHQSVMAQVGIDRIHFARYWEAESEWSYGDPGGTPSGCKIAMGLAMALSEKQ